VVLPVGVLNVVETPDNAIFVGQTRPLVRALTRPPGPRDYGWYDRLPPVDPNRPSPV
jgi:hypothetical protein